MRSGERGGRLLEPLLVSRSPSDLLRQIFPLGIEASWFGFRLNMKKTPSKKNEMFAWNKSGFVFNILLHF